MTKSVKVGLQKNNTLKDKNVLIVTHSAVSRVIHYLLGRIPEDANLSRLSIPNLRIIELKL